MGINYKVYVRLDDKNNVVEVESTAFYQEQEFIDKGFVFIDEGSDGTMYGHAQPNYMNMKYGKPTYDNDGRPNFKYENRQIVEIEEKDKKLIPTPSTSPTQEERIQALESAMLEMVLGGTE